MPMLFNYLTIAFRNLLKYKVFSIINVAGMAISLAICLLIALFVWDELKFDRHHPYADRTYRVYNIRNSEGVDTYLPIVPYPFASYMQKDFPEIESTLRIMDTYREQLFETEKERILEPHGLYAESTVFDILTIDVIAGKAADALDRPETIALSKTLATKYFGEEDPVGKTVKVDNRPCEVTAVYVDPPQHFHLRANYLISFSTLGWHNTHQDNWQRQQFFTYLKLKPNTDANQLEAKFKPFVEKYASETFKEKGFGYVPYLQNIRDIHLHSSNFEWEIAQRGSALSVYILSGSALLILVIACLNFVNLSTARAMKRMKEVGIRKIAGAQRTQLVVQFTAESVVLTLLGLILALVITDLVLPFANEALGKQISIPFAFGYVVVLVLFCVLLGMLAGSYPALYLSRFKPAAVLSKFSDARGKSFILRQSLVVLQFMLSFFLISGSWIVLSQNDLLHNKHLGFDKEQVVIVPLTRSQLDHQETTKHQYADHPNVISATIGYGLPGDIIAGDEIITPHDGQTKSASLFCVDFDYIKTMGMRLVAGRNLSVDFKTDSSEAFILNETAVNVYGYGSPSEAIGKKIQWNRWHDGAMKNGTIIGVVEDFNFRSLREKMGPVVLHIYPQAAWKMAVRIKPEDMDETLAHLKETYGRLEQNWIFSYHFLDENFDAMYKSEERLGKLFSVFAYLAIVVACMGLFGLVEYSVNQRAREVSIRKVFGASVSSIVVLLTRSYFALLGLAIALAIPACYYLSQLWLSNFAYRIDIGPMLFVKAGVIIITITAFTVSFQSIKTALSNPSRILKSE